MPTINKLTGIGACLWALLCLTVWPQQSNTTGGTVPISGWGNYRLGEPLSETISKLKKDPLLISKEPLESDIPEELNEYLVTMRPNRFFENFYFQFFNKKCHLIHLIYSKKFFSFLILYEQLKKKYGEPGLITYKRVEWEYQGARLLLERPTTVKYISAEGIATNIAPKHAEQGKEEYLRKELLDNL